MNSILDHQEAHQDTEAGPDLEDAQVVPTQDSAESQESSTVEETMEAVT
jgi:hypothetical protein